jgi:hypothetical protein
MSEDNVALARHSVDVFNRRDFDAFIGLMDKEVECVSRIVAIEGGLHGHEGVRRWWASWLEAFPDYRLEVVEAVPIGNAVLAALRAVTHGAGSTVALEDMIWHASEWRNGKCVWWRVLTSRAEALAAIEERRRRFTA